MSEKDIDNFFINPWYGTISTILTTCVVLISIWLTSRIKSILVRIISTLLFFVSTASFFGLLPFFWLFRNGIEMMTDRDIDISIKDRFPPGTIGDLFKASSGLILICAIIFGIGIFLCRRSYTLQKEEPPNKVE